MRHRHLTMQVKRSYTYVFFNPFVPNAPFLFDVLKWQRKGALGTTGLKECRFQTNPLLYNEVISILKKARHVLKLARHPSLNIKYLGLNDYYITEVYNQCMPYHSKRHFIDLMFVFRFLLPEWTVSEPKRKNQNLKSFWQERKEKRI